MVKNNDKLAMLNFRSYLTSYFVRTIEFKSFIRQGRLFQ